MKLTLSCSLFFLSLFFYQGLSNPRDEAYTYWLHQPELEYLSPESYQAVLEQAVQGDAKAQYQVARALFEGWPVEQNFVQGFLWLEQAASQGHPQAQASLGLHYYRGTKIEKNLKLALKLTQLSAQQSDPVGQYQLGIFFQTGLLNSLPRDEEQSKLWLEKSALQNYPPALFMQASVKNLTIGGRWRVGQPRLSKVIDPRVQKAAELGYPAAQAFLADTYLAGNKANQNKQLAFQLYQKAAAKDYAPAQAQLGTLYQKGIGTKKKSSQVTPLVSASCTE